MEEEPTRKRRRRRRGKGRSAKEPVEQKASPLERARRCARERFGVGKLRAEQERALTAVLEGRDALVVLPTGYGKSLLYQVPAMLAERPTLVVSPLIALMRDQEQALKRRGLPVIRLDSSLRVAERRAAYARLEEGGALLVLTTPETLESKDAGPRLEAARPSLFAIDEAHCISEWGHDFRPAYLRLAERRQALSDAPVLAVTATATPRVRDDILARLKMRAPALVVAPPHRPNLELAVEVHTGSSKLSAAGHALRRFPRPGIVYCATTVEVDRLYAALARSRIPAEHYHGKMRKADRDDAQARYMKGGKRRVMVATSAFGMGIDKPDIRYVLHYQAPGSLEQYVQEAGRGGRDGKPCRCLLLFDAADLEVQRRLLAQSRARSDQVRRVAKALLAWFDEDRAVSAKDLALSAEVPQTTARAVVARFEELALTREDERRDIVLDVTRAAFEDGAADLARRLEVERFAAERRLDVVRQYAESAECRSVFLRRYFGEDDPPRCGRCDRCREEGTSPAEATQRKKKRRRGRRGGRAQKSAEQRGSR